MKNLDKILLGCTINHKLIKTLNSATKNRCITYILKQNCRLNFKCFGL